jgi:enoyl-CoA hydratase
VSFTSTVLELDIADHVATLWLSRAEARNAMGSDLWRDLPLAAAAIAANREVRCVVIAARGPHFTVGLDLKEMGAMFMTGGNSSGGDSKAVTTRKLFDRIQEIQQAITCFEELEVPVIAAIHGYCIGGGIDLVTAADFRLASSDAIFSVREAKVGIVADLGTLQRLPRIVPAGHVAELAYTGADFGAERAEQIHLVNRVIEGSADEVYAAALDVALAIAANPPLAVTGTKSVLRANDGRTVAEGLDYVARWNSMYLFTDDLVEAMMSFLEHREPRYTGQ